MKRHRLLLLVTLIAGLSGFCSLVYQVVWDRTVKYNFGGDSISSAIVTGTFLLGLGLGAYIFGRWRRDAYKTYAGIEFAIGVFGILSFYLISPVASTLAEWMRTSPEEVEGLRAAVVVGCILLLLPPCTLIGGTLPLMLRCFVAPLKFSARTIGLVYGVNTLGASLGILAVPLLLLNFLSLPTTLAIIGGINIALGAIILLWARRRIPAEVDAVHAAVGTTSEGPAWRWLIFSIAFVSGFIAIGFEVSLFRAFQIVNPSSAYNFPAVLVLFLLALALGSIVLTRGVRDERDSILRRVGWLLAGSAIAMFLSIWAATHLHANWYPVSFMPMLDGEGYGNWPWVLLFAALLVMPVPFLTGAVFPLLLRLHSSSAATLPRGTGEVYLVNSLGSFAGAVFGKFVGFALLGTQGFLAILYILGCVLGLAILARLSWRAPRRAWVLPAGLLVLAVAVPLAKPAHVWQSYITGGPESNWEIREGVTGVAQIWWDGDIGDVRVNGQYMSRLPHHPRHVKQEIFLLAQPRREEVLVLGIGGGGIVRSLVEDDQVRRIYVVDWSYELPGLLSSGRAGELLNHALLSDKVTVLRTDARVAVGLFEPGRFDIVFDNLAFASWAGSSNIKSQAYFEKIRALLKPDGVYIKGANYFGANRLGVLAGLQRTFAVVKEHSAGEVVVSAARRPDYTDTRIRDVVRPRAPMLDMAHLTPTQWVNWFLDGFVTIGESQLHGAAPIRDNLLIHEYYWRLRRR